MRELDCVVESLQEVISFIEKNNVTFKEEIKESLLFIMNDIEKASYNVDCIAKEKDELETEKDKLETEIDELNEDAELGSSMRPDIEYLCSLIKRIYESNFPDDIESINAVLRNYSDTYLLWEHNKGSLK